MAEDRAVQRLVETAAGLLPAGPRRWTVELPCGRLLTSNTLGSHWRARHGIQQQIKADTMLLARYRKIPRLQRAHIIGEILPTSRLRRDPHNWQPSVKAAVDGLVAVGVLPDDNADHLLLTIFRIGVQIQCVHNPGRHVHLRLIISEVTR